MLEILKFHLWLKWIVIYLLCWAAEEIVFRLVLRWIFGPKNAPAEPMKPITT